MGNNDFEAYAERKRCTCRKEGHHEAKLCLAAWCLHGTFTCTKQRKPRLCAFIIWPLAKALCRRHTGCGITQLSVPSLSLCMHTTHRHHTQKHNQIMQVECTPASQDITVLWFILFIACKMSRLPDCYKWTDIHTPKGAWYFEKLFIITSCFHQMASLHVGLTVVDMQISLFFFFLPYIKPYTAFRSDFARIINQKPTCNPLKHIIYPTVPIRGFKQYLIISMWRFWILMLNLWHLLTQ